MSNLYFIAGNDCDVIENKWLTDFYKKYPDHKKIYYDFTIDTPSISELLTDYYVYDLFGNSKKIFIFRHIDKCSDVVLGFLEETCPKPDKDNYIICLSDSIVPGNTKLGKFFKKYFTQLEFNKPEIKPFDLLDALSYKNTKRVLQTSNRLFENGYNSLSLLSLIFNHFLLLYQVKEKEKLSANEISKDLKQHQFRIQKILAATHLWTKDELKQKLMVLSKLQELLYLWKYDDKMLLQMNLITLSRRN